MTFGLNTERRPGDDVTDTLAYQNGRPGSLVVGSEEHKELFCRFFIDTHITFDPAAIEWPDLDEGSLKLLHSLPVWAEAIETERMGTCTVQSWAELQTDPLIRQAVALQGQEEARHAAIIQGLTTRYGITLPTLPPPVPPVDAEWDFLRFGYSECFDAFFTFALFAIARDSGLISRRLVETFEHQHRPARLRQVGGRDQPIVPAAHYDHLVALRHNQPRYRARGIRYGDSRGSS